MDGYYEHIRDSKKYPCCWNSIDNTCLAHFHSSIEIVYVTEGEVEYTFNGQSGMVHPHQVVLAPSYTIHYYSTPVTSRSIVLTVPLDYVPSFRKLLAHRTFQKRLWEEPDGERELLRCLQKLTQICSVHGSQPPELFAKGYLYTVLAILAENLELTESEEENDTSLVRDILRYIDLNYRFDVTLETLACRFGYSKSRFSHLFHSYFGCGIPEYVNTLRCRNAALLITQESASLTDAAMNSGFESMRTFYRSFKKSFGVSPGEYLKEKKELGESGLSLFSEEEIACLSGNIPSADDETSGKEEGFSAIFVSRTM